MEIKPIFEDDSESLEHYGIPGMKWGVRNAETQRKYAGGKGIRSAMASLNTKRHTSAARALARDAKDLEAHGYKKEAAAVRKVASDGINRMARKDAKKTAKLDYGYGVRSRTNKQAHAKLVKERSKNLGSAYTDAYNNALAGQNRQKLAYKAQKSLQRDRKLASKSDTGWKTASKVGRTTAGIALGMIGTHQVMKYTGNPIAAAGAASIGSALGYGLGGLPADRVVKRRQDARRRLNYSY